MIHRDIIITFSPGLASIKIKAERNLCKLDIKQKVITISTISLQFSSLHQDQFGILSHHKQDGFQIVLNNLIYFEFIKILFGFLCFGQHCAMVSRVLLSNISSALLFLCLGAINQSSSSVRQFQELQETLMELRDDYANDNRTTDNKQNLLTK